LYDKKLQHLPLKDIIKIVKEAKKLGILSVTITGGEPSLHPDFFRILEYITSLGLSIGLISNGYNINKEKAEKILSYKTVYPWTSLDSHDEKINDLSRGKDAYKNSINFIKLIRQSDPNKYMGVISIITEYNIDTYEKTADFLINELNINEVRIDRPVILNNAEKNNLSNQKIIKKYIELAKKLSEKYEGRIKPVVCSYGDDCPMFRKSNFEINVFPDGNIIPCCFLHDSSFAMGNVKDKLTKVLDDENVEQYKKIMKNFLEKRGKEHEGLFTCVECIENYKRLRDSGKIYSIIKDNINVKNKTFFDKIKNLIKK